MTDISETSAHHSRSLFNSLTIAALGVVFGDIGTSPLYSVREAFHGTHAFPATPENILGVLSLILWSLFIVISIKYLGFVLKANNKGEGGVLALTSLAFPTKTIVISRLTKLILYLGLFGSALLVGDGIITPAISVLSAVEGLEIATPLFGPYVIPITLAILTGLFLLQHHGTARIGSVFGLVLLVWFLTLAALGIHGINQNSAILYAINPMYGFRFFLHNGFSGIVVLGAVFLVMTGGEALYADMGHFGRKPIEIAWFVIALPSLVLNYFGQGAILLSSPESAINPFYHLAPVWALYPLVIISTVATIIASQAVISGVFSLTRQAIQMGYAPRLRIVHTSSKAIGQIYIPKVNWGLYVLICWLVLEFKTSGALAAAYGVAVSTTMTITTILACTVALRHWNWGVIKTGLVFVFFFSIDFAFLGANFAKIANGGWFPLTIGAVVFTLMTTWKRGRQILFQRMRESGLPLSKFLDQISSNPLPKVPGVAFFMTGDPYGTPLALLHNVQHNKILHEKNVLLTVLSEDVPCVSMNDRVNIETVAEGFYRIKAYYGFAETPKIQDIINACALKDLNFKLGEITFFLGRETLLNSNKPGMAMWRNKLFSFMSKNAERATAYYDIPSRQVLEMGIQIEL